MIARLNCNRELRASSIKDRLIHPDPRERLKEILGIEYVDFDPEDSQRELKVYLFVFQELSHEEFVLESLSPGVEPPQQTPSPEHVEAEKYIKLVFRTDFPIGRYRISIRPTSGRGRYPLDPITGSFEFVVGQSEDPIARRESCSSRVSAPVGLAQPVGFQSEDPDIPYIAKDYESFRRLILNRLSTIMPDWQEKTPADLGMVLVELLAAVGNKLSYRQDAVATEAYLGTARLRTSVRRHLRLLDIKIHEGCSARGFVQVYAAGQSVNPVDQFYFLTEMNRQLSAPRRPASISEASIAEIERKGTQQYEPVDFAEENEFVVDKIQFSPSLNTLFFYTWDGAECQLKAGATSATLWFGDSDQNPSDQSQSRSPCPTAKQLRLSTPAPPLPDLKNLLQPGCFLLIEEVIGANTGNPSDALPTKKQFVRVTKIHEGMKDPVHRDRTVWKVEWHPDDTLTQDFCVSTQLGPEFPGKDCEWNTDITVARGNVVAVEHRTSHRDVKIGETPPDKYCKKECDSEFELAELELEPRPIVEFPLSDFPHLAFGRDISNSTSAKKFTETSPDESKPLISVYGAPAVRLAEGGLAELTPKRIESDGALFDFLAGSSVHPLLRRRIQELLPPEFAVTVKTADGCGNASKYLKGHIWKLLRQSTLWTPVDSLLSSGPRDQHFVVEMDDRRVANLRFGDGKNGARPLGNTVFYGTFKTSSLTSGNIGSELIQHVVTRSGSIFASAVKNPFPVSGAELQEDVSRIQQNGPSGKVERQTAVLAEDYREIVMREFGESLQNASASIRPMGSFQLVTIVVDPFVRSDRIDNEVIQKAMQKYRQIGHEIRVIDGTKIEVNLTIQIFTSRGVSASEVRESCEAALSDIQSPNGSLGFFHPDRLTFGESIFANKVTESVNSIPGVENSSILRLERADLPNPKNQVVEFGPLEVAVRGNVCLEIEDGHVN